MSRYKIFVSANQKELKEERLSVKEIIINNSTLREFFDVFLIFHETKDMEKFGTGVGKMKRLMKEHGLSKPEFKEEGGFFVVRFYGPGDKILDLIPSIPKERQVDLKELGLNERQIESLKLMVNEGKRFSNREYRKAFNVSNQTFVRDMKALTKLEFVTTAGVGRSLKYKAK